MEFRFSMHVGDYIDVTVWPRASHDCDGVYIVDVQIWEHDGMKKSKFIEPEVCVPLCSISDFLRLVQKFPI